MKNTVACDMTSCSLLHVCWLLGEIPLPQTCTQMEAADSTVTYVSLHQTALQRITEYSNQQQSKKEIDDSITLDKYLELRPRTTARSDRHE
jgi:hypothetical protein